MFFGEENLDPKHSAKSKIELLSNQLEKKIKKYIITGSEYV